jgi:hypothetical protein
MTLTALTPQQLRLTWRSVHIHGGNFGRHLAEAWLAADPINRARIEAAFPHLLEKYGPSSPFYEG